MAQKCGKWWSFGRQLGIEPQQLRNFRNLFGYFEDSLNGRKARILVLDRFISKYEKTTVDTVEHLTILLSVAERLGCHTLKLQIGKMLLH